MFHKLIRFLTDGLWTIPYNEYSRIKSWLVHTTRVLILSGKGFFEDECFLRASALTYLAMLSIVPVLAVVFGIAKGFGLEQNLEKEIFDHFNEYREIVAKLISFTHSLLKQVESNVVAGFGVVFLFGIVMMLLSNIESTFNTIWKIPRPRTFLRKCSDYFAMMILSPIMFIAASSFTVFILSKAVGITREHWLIGPLEPLLMFSFHLVPFFLVWILFSLIYIFMPNTKVPWKYGITAGVIAGTTYQILQWIYLHFQILVSDRYGAIYGSFAAVPLFLLWVEASWIILLIGAEIAYYSENEAYHFSDPRFADKPQRLCSRRLVETFIAWRFIQAFGAGQAPLNSMQISIELGLPLAKTEGLLRKLVDINILTEVKNRGKISMYQPAKNVEWLSLKTVSDALNRSGHEQLAVTYSDALQKVAEKLKEYDDRSVKLQENVLLNNL